MRLVLSTLALALSQQCDKSTFKLNTGTDDSKFASKMASSPEECCGLCGADPECGHFVFVTNQSHLGADQKNCRLKKGASFTPRPTPGLVAGTGGTPTPTPAPPTPPPTPVAPPPLGFQPHLIFFLGDDVGHYNMGWRNNSEARTPNIDGLVKEGIILDRHYVYQYCSPTRSAFLSGRLPIHVNTKNEGPNQKGGVDLRMTMIAEKLKRAGYKTHQVGKWNAGSASWGSMPVNRGFDSSYGYMGGAEDHYTQIGDYKIQANGNNKIVDLWENDGPAYGKNGSYNAFHFTEHTVDIIHSHDPSTPLFVYHAWQEAHTPNEVPQQFVGPALSDDNADKLRQTYEGMVHCLDSGIGNITAALRAKGMWDKTLIIFSADNGGREDGGFGGNNWPLRGMKFSDFEGGVRVAAFASGGVIPAARRGGTEAGIVHISDWYHTYCALAGVDAADAKAAAGQVPPIDSQNVWPVLSTGAASPHLPANRPGGLVISSAAIIMWPYKLVTGKQGGKGVWTGPHHPNSTKLTDDDPGCGGGNSYLDAVMECDGDYDCVAVDASATLGESSNKHGCLFNIEEDPTEHADLSSDPAHADVLKNLTAALAAAQQTEFQTKSVFGYDNCTTTEAYVRAHKNFGGPICYNGTIPFL